MIARPEDKQKYYIKMTFAYSPWSVTDIGGGIVATLKGDPVIITELPAGVVTDKYSKQLKSLFTSRDVMAGFFHDCGDLSLDEIKSGLENFRKHYDDFKQGHPAVELQGRKPRENELIANLIVALENIRRPVEERVALAKSYQGNPEEILDQYTY